MSSNTTEEQIRKKIEGLDTLQAGIVYGKEDAWDKLQAKMEAKPERKVIPFFRMAAAAALVLLFITIGILFKQPKQEEVANNNTSTSVKDIEHPQDTFTVPAPTNDLTPAPVTHQPGIAQKHANPVVKSVKPPVEPEVVEEIKEVAVTNPISNLTPAKPKMKVIHINELDKEDAPVYEVVDNDELPHSHIFFKMKVVHINDLARPMLQEDYLRDAERNTVWHLPFSRKAYEVRLNDNRPHNFLRINLSN